LDDRCPLVRNGTLGCTSDRLAMFDESSFSLVGAGNDFVLVGFGQPSEQEADYAERHEDHHHRVRRRLAAEIERHAGAGSKATPGLAPSARMRDGGGGV
jgi:hypothetical protein